MKSAKEQCGYQAAPVYRVCGNCGSYRSDWTYPKWIVTFEARAQYDVQGGKLDEVNKRCSDHGFSVKKSATCLKWRPA